MDNWKINIHAITHTMEGRTRRINVTLNGCDFDKLQTVVDVVNNRKKPYEFYGVPICVRTPLHYTEYVIDPDTQELKCIS